MSAPIARTEEDRDRHEGFVSGLRGFIESIKAAQDGAYDLDSYAGTVDQGDRIYDWWGRLRDIRQKAEKMLLDAEQSGHEAEMMWRLKGFYEQSRRWGADFHITDIVMRQAYKQAVMGLCPHNLNEVDKCAEWAGRMANAMLAEDDAHEANLRGES